MSHLAYITIKLEDTFQICWAICTSHLPKCRQNVSNWRSKPFSPCTWQPAFCLQKGETEQGKYCLLPHSKTDNRFPLCCQTSIQVTCSNFRQSVMPLLLEDSKFCCSFQCCFHSSEWGHYCTYQVHLPTAKGYNPQTSSSISQFWFIKEITLPHNTSLWWGQKVLCWQLHFTLKPLHKKTLFFPMHHFCRSQKLIAININGLVHYIGGFKSLPWILFFLFSFVVVGFLSSL